MDHLVITRRQYLELEKIAFGAFAPLSGFMNESDFRVVVERMRLESGELFPLPVVLDVSRRHARELKTGNRLSLVFNASEVGEIQVETIYSCDKMEIASKVYGTSDMVHPGVAHFMDIGDVFVGGPVELKQRHRFEFSEYELTPAETTAYFEKQGWRTIVGFQTRNIPHRAHEYLQRLALEQADGLFIQPLVGRKKRGDYRPEAILTAYRALIERFLPGERILLGVLSTAMRYAGPREALFHTIVRRNYGCTHFIVGRDHAGVGGYYERYAAHDLVQRFEDELEIKVLRLAGPFYCQICDGIATERTCSHVITTPTATQEISGTLIREMLAGGKSSVSRSIIRPEILEAITGMPIFIEEDDE